MHTVLRFCKKYKAELWFTIALALTVMLAYFSGINCLIKRFAGIDCPACGMTRAYISLLQGDFSKAFHFHPLFFTVPVIYLVLFFRKRFSDRFLVIFIAAVIASYVIVYILRLFFITDSLIYLNL